MKDDGDIEEQQVLGEWLRIQNEAEDEAVNLNRDRAEKIFNSYIKSLRFIW